MQDAYIEEQKDFREYLSFIGRRRWPMILTALVVVIVAAAVAVLLPPAYRSTATILIEEQEIQAGARSPRTLAAGLRREERQATKPPQVVRRALPAKERPRQ